MRQVKCSIKIGPDKWKKKNWRSLIRKARDGHTHSSGTDESSNEDKDILVIAWKTRANFFCNRHQQYTSYCVTDESGNDLGWGNKEQNLDIHRKGHWLKILPTNTTGDKINTTVYRVYPLMRLRMIPSSTLRRPLDITPLPNAIPPMARNTIVHAKCSKSS